MEGTAPLENRACEELKALLQVYEAMNEECTTNRQDRVVLDAVFAW